MTNATTAPEPKPPIAWAPTTVFIATFLIAAVGVPWYAVAVGFEWSAIVAFVLFIGITGISITAGYHRLWAHRAYQAHWSLRLLFAFFGAATVQNSILSWVTGHRRHHLHVDDNDRDPYSAGRGLWFSHMGWMVRQYPSGAEDRSNVRDLERDPIVVWQDKHYVAIAWTANLAPTLLVGWLTGDWLANLLLMGFARLVITHHTTFFINSLAHFWGRRPFSREHSARDNPVLALFTHGEGYHNFHHEFQSDYRNGIRWFDWDPTKWLIAAASFVGLTWNLKTVDRIRIRQAQVAVKLQEAEDRLAKIPEQDRWRSVLEQEYVHFKHCLEAWKALPAESIDRGRQRIAATGRGLQRSARAQVRALERALKLQVRRLQALQTAMVA